MTTNLPEHLSEFLARVEKDLVRVLEIFPTLDAENLAELERARALAAMMAHVAGEQKRARIGTAAL